MPPNTLLYSLYAILFGLLIVEFRRLIEGNGIVDRGTGLPTQAFFRSYLMRCAARARQVQDYEFAVVYIELQPTPAQSRSARRISKEMIIDTAHRMRETLRTSDVVMHVRQENFLILLDNVSVDDDSNVQALLSRIRVAASNVMTRHGKNAFATARFGVAIGGEGSMDARTLIAQATAALGDNFRLELSGA